MREKEREREREREREKSSNKNGHGVTCLALFSLLRDAIVSLSKREIDDDLRRSSRLVEF